MRKGFWALTAPGPLWYSAKEPGAAALILFPAAAATARSVTRPMADWEIEAYSAYDLALPGAAGAAPTPAEILAYWAPDGTITQTVYDAGSDTAYFLSPDKKEAYTNFRRG